jgi:glutamate synthase (NADPH/NADH) small chain
MPSWPGERIDALEEAIDLYPYVMPKKIQGKKKVESIECVRLKPGDKDKTGRPKPITVPDSEFEIEADSIIFAIGQKISEPFKQANPEIINSKGLIKIGKKYETPIKGVFAGGDVTNGGATVVEAIRDGKEAVKSINFFIGGI